MFNDVRLAVRSLLKAPLFCAVVILTLSLGVGANTAVFGVIHATMLDPLPYPNSHELVRVTLQRDGEHRYFPGAGFIDLRANSRTMDVASIFTYREEGADLSGPDRTERVPLTYVSANYFAVMGVAPVAGRVFDTSEERAGARIAVVSERIWREYLASRSNAIGETLVMDGVPVQVVGVLPAGFTDPLQPRVELWLPENLQPGVTNAWGNNRLSVIARLRPKATVRTARVEAEFLVSRQAENYGKRRPTTVQVMPLQQALVGNARPLLFVLLAAVALLLLLACVNVASLLLARGAARSQEMSVRAALGSSRWRLARQQLIESLLLSAAGGVSGWIVAVLSAGVLVAAAPSSVAGLASGPLDPQVFAYCLAIAALAGLTFGIVPALQASTPELEGALRSGLRGGGTSRGQRRTWNGLVIAQIALALVLVVGAGLLLKSFQRLRAVDLGFQPAGVLTFQVNLPGGRYSEGERRAAFYRALHARLEALPQVRAAGAVSRLPVLGTYQAWGTRLAGYGEVFASEQRVVEGRYFDVMRIPLVAGRAFDASDTADVERRVVISRSLARAMFGDVDPIGREVQTLNYRARVIGVVGDVALDARGTRAAVTYHGHQQFAGNRNWSLTQLIAVAGEDPSIVGAIRRELAGIDPALVLHAPQPLDDVIGRDRARERFALQLVGAFALLAVVLAAVGLYGLLAFTVASRRKEIGIRLALGSRPQSIIGHFLAAGARLVAAGLLLGIVSSVPLTRMLQSLLFEISSLDVLVFAAAAGTLCVAGLLAAWLPARSAARVDPLEVIGR